MWSGGSAPDSRGTRPPAWLTRMTDHTRGWILTAGVFVCVCVRPYARVIWTWNRGVAACGGGGRSSGTGSVCVCGRGQYAGTGGPVVVLNYEPFTFQSETSEGFGWEIDNGALTSPASALRLRHPWFRWFWVVWPWIYITFSTLFFSHEWVFTTFSIDLEGNCCRKLPWNGLFYFHKKWIIVEKSIMSTLVWIQFCIIAFVMSVVCFL